MDPNTTPESPAPAEEPKVTTDPTPSTDSLAPAPEVSVSLNDPAPAPAPAINAPTTAGTNPGHTLGVASLVVSILGIGIVGLILGILGLNKSKKAGQKNGLALAGIIIGAVNIVALTIIIIVASMGISQLASKCAELGTGTHVEGDATYTCS